MQHNTGWAWRSPRQMSLQGRVWHVEPSRGRLSRWWRIRAMSLEGRLGGCQQALHSEGVFWWKACLGVPGVREASRSWSILAPPGPEGEGGWGSASSCWLRTLFCRDVFVRTLCKRILVANLVKDLPANAGGERDKGSVPGSGRSPGGEMATISSILAWRVPWTEEPGGLQSTGLQWVGHDWVCTPCLQTILIHLSTKRWAKESKLRAGRGGVNPSEGLGEGRTPGRHLLCLHFWGQLLRQGSSCYLSAHTPSRSWPGGCVLPQVQLRNLGLALSSLPWGAHSSRPPSGWEHLHRCLAYPCVLVMADTWL